MKISEEPKSLSIVRKSRSGFQPDNPDKIGIYGAAKYVRRYPVDETNELEPVRKELAVREVEIVEGTHTFTRTRTHESPKYRVGVEEKEI